MSKLVIPNFPPQQMGQVIATITEVPYALLGVTSMEILGLEPNLKNHQLRILPMNSEQTYLSVL